MTIEALVQMAAAALAGAAAVELLRSRRLAGRLGEVALCSHELRGALTAMGLALSRLEHGAVATDAVRLLALRDGYDRAVWVARDLEAARGMRGERSIQRPELVDLRDIAARVVDAWSDRLSGSAPVSLDWRAGAALIHGYPVRLAQALDNLVANAVEHGRGPVTVLGRAAAGMVSVSVLDRGSGLVRPLEDVRRRSWQAPRGHGLVIARHAVELHGGSLRTVRGPLGAGVEMRLPAGADAAPVRDSRRPAPRRSGSGAAAP